MTRAKKYLFLTYPKTINLFGRITKTNKSPFIEKINTELIEFNKHIAKKKKPDDEELSLF